MIPRWLVWTLVALCSWGIWGVLSKLIGDSLNSPHSQLLSTAGMLPIMLGLMLTKQKSSHGNRRKGNALAFGSGLVSCLGNLTFFGVLEGQGAKAATVIPLTSMAPLVTLLLAVPILRERLSWLQMMGVTLSALAIYLFNIPTESIPTESIPAESNSGFLSPWIFPALVTIAFWGAAGLLQKMATNEISGESAMVGFLWAFVLLAGVLFTWQGIPDTISVRSWVITFAMGFTLALGNLAILLAFTHQGKASIISPLCGLYPLISLPLAILCLGETIHAREWSGILVSLIAVMLISWESSPSDTSSRLELKT